MDPSPDRSRRLDGQQRIAVSLVGDGIDPADVELIPVTGHGWRLCDRRIPAGQPLHVLGFVERRGDVYETLQIGQGFESGEAATLEGAVAVVLSTAAATEHRRFRDEAGGVR